MASIYISSTFADLEPYRRAVYDQLHKMKHTVVSMEDYTAGDQRPLDKCLEDVAACDIYVGIFAWRYGYIPKEGNPEGHSITELEYRKATETSKERLVFLLDESVPWPRSATDDVTKEGDAGARIKALRTELATSHMGAFFKSPEDLVGHVDAALVNALDRLQQKALAGEREAREAESERRHQGAGERVVGLPALDIGPHFQGRREEARRLGELLAEPSTRVVSIVGRAGIGKTALASRVLGDLEDNRWPHTDERIPVDGIVYLSRGPTTEITFEELFMKGALMLGGEHQVGLLDTWTKSSKSIEQKVEHLLGELAHGAYVILLDHVEDMLDDEGHFTDPDLRLFFERALLTQHGARLVLTSRDRLGFRPEMMAFDMQVSLRKGLSTEEGVAMLRGMDPNGEWGLRELPDATLAAAVERLHGIPRAIEVLAGIVRDDPLRTLGEILQDFYEEDAASEVIREGYRRLDADERLVIDVLAVLGAPASRLAVEFMVTPFRPGQSIGPVVRRLIHLQMVKADRETKTLSLDSVDQDQVHAQLPEEGTENRTALELRAADYYAQLRTPPESWHVILDVEPQVREFEHRMKAGDVDGAARVLVEVDDFLIGHGHARRVQAMHGRVAGKINDRALEMHHHFGLGWTHIMLGPPETAITHMAQAKNIAVELGDREIERRANKDIGEAHRRLGHIDAAITFLEHAVSMFDPEKERPEQSGLLELSLSYSYRGRLDEAIDTGERLLSLGQAMDDVHAQAQGHDALSLVTLVQGRLDETIQHTDQALTLYRQVGSQDPEGYVLNVQGMAYLRQGRLDEAIRALEAGAARGEVENPRLEGYCLFNMARIHRLRDDLDAALKAAESARTRFEAMGAPEERAAAAMADAILAQRDGDRERLAKALLETAKGSAHSADLLSPVDLVDEAAELAAELGRAGLAAWAANLKGELAKRMGTGTPS
jgi:tetratricopeptide (TPR) repeat protein